MSTYETSYFEGNIEIEYKYQGGIKATLYDPPVNESIDIISITLDGRDYMGTITDKEYKKLESRILNHIHNEQQDFRVNQAECKREVGEL